MTLDDAMDFCGDLSGMVRAWALDPVRELQRLRQIEESFLLDLPADHPLVQRVTAAVAAVRELLTVAIDGTPDLHRKKIANAAIEQLRLMLPYSYGEDVAA